MRLSACRGWPMPGCCPRSRLSLPSHSLSCPSGHWWLPTRPSERGARHTCNRRRLTSSRCPSMMPPPGLSVRLPQTYGLLDASVQHGLTTRSLPPRQSRMDCRCTRRTLRTSRASPILRLLSCPRRQPPRSSDDQPFSAAGRSPARTGANGVAEAAGRLLGVDRCSPERRSRPALSAARSAPPRPNSQRQFSVLCTNWRHGLGRSWRLSLIPCRPYVS